MMGRWVISLACAALLIAAAFFAPRGSVPTEAALVAQQEQAQPAQKNQTNKKKNAKKAAESDTANFLPAPKTAEEAGVPVLSTGDSYDDFATVAQTSDGTLFAAYAAYYDGHDQIRLHKKLANGNWSTRVHVPLVEAEADIWMPHLAVDSKDRLWVIWCEQVGRSKGKTGNWDLYARYLDSESWGPIVRLSTDPKPDINPHVITDKKGNITVVWQGHTDNTGDVMICRFDGNNWSAPAHVTKGLESDWYPRVALDAQGTAWIAFDSYRNGDYDVFLTSWNGTAAGQVIPIATSKYYEAHATVGCTPDGGVWVAWEQGGWNWGKDQGYWLRKEDRLQGTTLGNTRTLKTAVYHNGKLSAGPALEAALPAGQEEPQTASATFATDADGRLWLRFRQHMRALRGVRQSRYWSEWVTYLTETGWKPATEMAASAGRISVFSQILPAKDGSLVVAYSSDQRGPANYHQPIHDRVLIGTVPKPSDPPRTPSATSPYQPPQPVANMAPWDVNKEKQQVAAIRAARVTIDGKPHRIVRGDLHRHTEMSWDVGPGNDGSYLDFYRYMIDVAEMDFGALTDHQGGGQYAYHWWLTEKSCDMYYLAPRYVPLYGYERSARFPDGHRNIFHSYRGVPIFAFQIKLNESGVFPGVGAGNLVSNDTKLLYEYLRKTGGIAISHTSTTSSMGTDWRDNDREIEPVVEIYQGARNSAEAKGAPRVHGEDEPPDAAPGGFQKAGYLWNAYAKGYRLGITSSSDHGSTHISYSLVWVPENDRAEIIDAIRKRHTYGSTDNMIVAMQANGHFMGDEFSTKDKPSLTLKATGTGKVKEAVLVRNNAYIHTFQVGKGDVEVSYTDMQPDKGLNLYYFRLLQDDGELAWSSPVWVNVQ